MAPPTDAHLYDDLTGDGPGRGNSGPDLNTALMVMRGHNAAFEDRRKNCHM